MGPLQLEITWLDSAMLESTSHLWLINKESEREDSLSTNRRCDQCLFSNMALSNHMIANVLSGYIITSLMVLKVSTFKLVSFLSLLLLLFLVVDIEVIVEDGLTSLLRNCFNIFRNPNFPSPLEKIWPQYTADRGEYLGLSPNLAVRFKMRPEKMALWNEFLPSQMTVEPTTASHIPTTADTLADDNKGACILQS